jgi:DNA-binding transcriptional LysR family regulator
LLSRGPKNKMLLTPKAYSLIYPVREAVEKCKKVFTERNKFNPKTAVLNFNIAMNDYASSLLVPDLTKLLQKEAPNITSTIANLNDLVDYSRIYSENYDLVVGSYNIESNNIESEQLFLSELCCVISKSHPLSSKRVLTKMDLLRFPFIHVQLARRYWNEAFEFIDKQIKGRRKIIATVPHIFVALSMLDNTQYICITHKIIAGKFSKNFNITTVEPPFKLKAPSYSMYWKKVDELNPANIWLRQMIRKVMRKFSIK